MRKTIEVVLSIFKYLLAIFMMVAGVATMFSPLIPLGGAFGFIYHTRVALVLFGSIFFISGSILLYAKIVKSRKWTGIGLMLIYLCFLFSAILNGFAYDGRVDAWLGNIIMSLVTGALYLRWKFQTHYTNPKHFRRP